MENPATKAAAVDHWTAVGAASVLIGINQLIINVQPLLLGALATSKGLSDTQLGLISSALIGGASCASATAPLWVRQVNWRAISSILVGVALAALFLTTLIDEFFWLCIAFAGIGLLKGGIGAPSFVCLGDTRNPERNFGTSVAVQSGMAALAAAPMAAYLIPHYGPNGVYYCLMAALLLGLAAARFLPAGGLAGRGGKQQARIVLSPALLPFSAVMIAMMCFTVGVTGFWFFLERIGSAKQVPASIIGLAVSGTALVTIPGSFAVTWLSRWLNGLRFAVLGSILIIAGYVLIGLSGSGPFLAGSLMFAFGWGVSQPGYWALARETDPTGRLFVLSPALSSMAAVLTGLVAGPIIEGSGYDGLMIVSGLLIAAGIIFVVAAKRLSRAVSQSQANSVA